MSDDREQDVETSAIPPVEGWSLAEAFRALLKPETLTAFETAVLEEAAIRRRLQDCDEMEFARLIRALLAVGTLIRSSPAAGTVRSAASEPPPPDTDAIAFAADWSGAENRLRRATAAALQEIGKTVEAKSLTVAGRELNRFGQWVPIVADDWSTCDIALLDEAQIDPETWEPGTIGRSGESTYRFTEVRVHRPCTLISEIAEYRADRVVSGDLPPANGWSLDQAIEAILGEERADVVGWAFDTVERVDERRRTDPGWATERERSAVVTYADHLRREKERTDREWLDREPAIMREAIDDIAREIARRQIIVTARSSMGDTSLTAEDWKYLRRLAPGAGIAVRADGARYVSIRFLRSPPSRAAPTNRYPSRKAGDVARAMDVIRPTGKLESETPADLKNALRRHLGWPDTDKTDSTIRDGIRMSNEHHGRPPSPHGGDRRSARIRANRNNGDVE